MADEEVESVVQEFMDDLINWREEVRDYSEEVRGLEKIHTRLQVWGEVYQTGDWAGKKCESRLVSPWRVETGGAGDSFCAGADGASGMVRGASG